MSGNQPLPCNLDECLDQLRTLVEPRQLAEFARMPEDEAVVAGHHSLGRWLRNRWGLWSESDLKSWFVARGIWHADDMSGIIMTSLHRALNGRPVDFDAQVQFFKEYWENQEPNTHGAWISVDPTTGATIIKPMTPPSEENHE